MGLFDKFVRPWGSAPPRSNEAPVDPATVDKAVLTEEIAAAEMMGVRSIISTHPTRGMTPQRLAGVLIEAEQGNPYSYLDLAEDMEEKDLHYLSVLGTRKRAVAQLDITVEEAGDDSRSQQDADLVREWLKRDELQAELFDILDAVGKGFSATEIIWQTSAKQWMPSQLKRRDPRWFLPDLINGEDILLRDVGPPVPLQPYKFIVHKHPAKSGLPIRAGLARPVGWAWLFKNFGLKDWVSFAEIYGMPLRIGKHEPGETKENIRALARAVGNLGSDAAAVISKSMEIEFLDGKGSANGGPDLYLGLCSYLDQQISKATLGQTATTDAINGGHAVGKTHNDVRHDIQAADAKLLETTLNRDLVRPLVDLNNGPPPSGKYPRICLPLPESVDITALSGALAKLVPMGLKVGQAWARKKIGAPDPADDEELLTAPATPEPLDDPADPGEAQDGLDGDPEATEAAAGRRRGVRSLSKPLTGQARAAGTAKLAAADAIDRAAAAALADWKPLAEPLIMPIHDLVASCSSLDELRDKLAGAIDGMNVDQLAQLLAQAGFSGRLAGLTGETLE